MSVRGPGLLVLALLLAEACAGPSATPGPKVPSEGPRQVAYDAVLTDPFFDSPRLVVPSHFIEVEPGLFEDTHTGETVPESELPRQPQTARLDTDHQLPHTIRFGTARLLEDGTLEIAFSDTTPATNDELVLRVRGDTFEAEYASVYPVRERGPAPSWKCGERKLRLDASGYHTGDAVRGHLQVLCEERLGDERVGSFRIEGPFAVQVK